MYNTESRKRRYSNKLERKKVKRTDHILRRNCRNCFLKYVVGRKIVGRNDDEEEE
jgi:hypothetical protein